MKWLLLYGVLALSPLVFGEPIEGDYPRGCIYALGKCIRECKEGTHAYATGCSRKTPEPTCQNPNPEPEEFIICDFSACYCDAPTVRDPISKKCVHIADCTVST